MIFAKGFSPFNSDDFNRTKQLSDYWSRYLNNNGSILIITRTNFSGKSPTGWKFLDEEGINSLYDGHILKKEIVYFWSKFWVLIHVLPASRFLIDIASYVSKVIVAGTFKKPVSVYIFLTKNES